MNNNTNKLKPILALALLAALAAPSASAADRKLMLPLEVAMNQKDAEAKLDDSIKFYFGDTAAPKGKRLGSDSTSAKTNAFGKSDERACNWAFLSAMLSLQKRAKELGADAVVNIVSNYKHQVMSSTTEFECHAGAMIAGVALKADFVKTGDK